MQAVACLETTIVLMPVCIHSAGHLALARVGIKWHGLVVAVPLDVNLAVFILRRWRQRRRRLARRRLGCEARIAVHIYRPLFFKYSY